MFEIKSILPVERLSIITNLNFFDFNNLEDKTDPIYPAPPVIKIDLIILNYLIYYENFNIVKLMMCNF